MNSFGRLRGIRSARGRRGATLSCDMHVADLVGLEALACLRRHGGRKTGHAVRSGSPGHRRAAAASDAGTRPRWPPRPASARYCWAPWAPSKRRSSTPAHAFCDRFRVQAIRVGIGAVIVSRCFELGSSFDRLRMKDASRLGAAVTSSRHDASSS